MSVYFLLIDFDITLSHSRLQSYSPVIFIWLITYLQKLFLSVLYSSQVLSMNLYRANKNSLQNLITFADNMTSSPLHPNVSCISFIFVFFPLSTLFDFNSLTSLVNALTVSSSRAMYPLLLGWWLPAIVQMIIYGIYRHLLCHELLLLLWFVVSI